MSVQKIMMAKSAVEEPPPLEAVAQNAGPKFTVFHSSDNPRRNTAAKRVVWIDIDNSPHVPFFMPIIEELDKRGIELVLTARNLYQVCDLLDFFGLRCKVIGGHYGKNKLAKILGNCVRALQLAPTVIKFRPELALSHGSRAQVLICKATGVPTIMMHDYEHSTKTGFLKPDWIFTPEVIPDLAMHEKSGSILKYPGLKEDVYVPRFSPDISILTELGISPKDLLVTLRPPATEAHYHNPESEALFRAAVWFIADKPHVRAVVLPRNAGQNSQLRKEWADLISTDRMILPARPVNGLNLIWFSDLVISGGGTMNREAAALGVPVYSVFRGKIGAVDQYLAREGRLTLIERVEDIAAKIALTRWNRPARPENANTAVLRSIVDKIVSILEA